MRFKGTMDIRRGFYRRAVIIVCFASLTAETVVMSTSGALQFLISWRKPIYVLGLGYDSSTDDFKVVRVYSEDIEKYGLLDF